MQQSSPRRLLAPLSIRHQHVSDEANCSTLACRRIGLQSGGRTRQLQDSRTEHHVTVCIISPMRQPATNSDHADQSCNWQLVQKAALWTKPLAIGAPPSHQVSSPVLYQLACNGDLCLQWHDLMPECGEHQLMNSRHAIFPQVAYATHAMHASAQQWGSYKHTASGLEERC